MNNFTKYICRIGYRLTHNTNDYDLGIIWKLQRLSERIVRLHKKAATAANRPVHDNDCHELGYHCSPAFHPVPPEQKTG